MSTLIASAAERNRHKRQLVEQAVKMAMTNEWQQAVEINRQLIELAPDEPDAWNRLGKALAEQGKYVEGRDAYQEALNRDPANSIAIKQVKRLALIAEAAPSGDTSATKLDPKLLIEETGKTGIFELLKPAVAASLARMTPGDKVELKAHGSDLQVVDHNGRRLGILPPKIAVRLIELINGGNEYVAGVTIVGEKHIRVLIRELRQSAAMDGRVSFPGKSGPLPPELRAYTKDRAVRFDVDDDEIGGEDTDDEAEDADTEETTADIEYYEESGDSSSSADE